eukprot:355308-Alexandrium_andersonii.AAC.1
MSASLVGSEMCIRDSLLVELLRPRRARGAQLLEEDLREGLLVVSVDTVSYTHLTLPTICSV